MDEIIKLGRHRLLCGDARKLEDIEKLISGYDVNLILTDPPYGMRAQDSNGCIGNGNRDPIHFYNQIKKWGRGDKTFHQNVKAKKYPLLIGDDKPDTAKINFELTKDICKKQIIFGGQYFADFLPINGGWLFWDKQNGKNDFSDGELAWRSWGKKVCKYEHKWSGVYREGSTILNGRTRVHPTQKPVELFANILEDFCVKEGVVLDCFGGSGTTLIACEITGRTCLMMEMSEEYCKLIAERYNKVKENYFL